jgi:AraC-like DNA-binding protein
MTFVHQLYFSVFVFALITFVDLLIKFKRPLILKIILLILVACLGIASFIQARFIDTTNFIFLFVLFKAIIASCFVQIFSILYFPKFKKWVNINSVILISFTIFTYFYSAKYIPNYSSNLKAQTIVIVVDQGIKLPLFFKIVKPLLIVSFFSTFVYFLYNITLKFNLSNIYFDKIKRWTIAIFLLIINILVLYFPFPFYKSHPEFGHYITIYLYLYFLLVVFYRPTFLNKSSLKISLGESFKKESEFKVSELDFINEFYTKLYFTNKDANLEGIAQKLNVNVSELYRFIYNKYDMTFNDMVNKNRISYFIDIVNNPKYKNYTIDALAKEVGFSSRQHLYKPFKKFHGGNPSDIIEAINL